MKLPAEIEERLATLPTEFQPVLRVWVETAYRAGVRDSADILAAAGAQLPEIKWPLSATTKPAEVKLEAEPAAPQDIRLPKPVDCATLIPLTRIQFELFQVIVAAKGEYMPASEIDRRAGKVGAFGNVEGLVNKGYICRRPVPGLPKNANGLHVICFGAPKILAPDEMVLKGRVVRISRRPPAPVQPSKPAEKRPEPMKSAEIRQNPPVSAAPAPAQRTHYPPVASLRKPFSEAPTSARMHGNSTTATQEIFGRDGNGGHPMEKESAGIKVTTYLIRKGHSAALARGGWQVDGKYLDRWEVLDLINEHRKKADLPPAIEADLE